MKRTALGEPPVTATSPPQPAWLSRAFTTAARHYQAGLFHEARTLLISILEREPKHADSLYLLASVAGQSGDLALAEGLLRQAIAIDAGKPVYWVLLGNTLQRGERLEESEVCYQMALSIGGEHADPYYNWGNTCERQGRNREALELFRRAVDLNPHHVEALNNLANQLRATGALDEAVPHLEAARRLRPDLMPPVLNLGNVYMAANHFPEALACFEEAIRMAPNVAILYCNRGNALRGLKRTSEAIASFREAIGREPQRAEFWVNLGGALQLQGRMREAFAAFEQAHAFAPESAEAHGAILFAMHYDTGRSVTSILEAHREWGQRHTGPLRRTTPFSNSRDPGRQLRIGYISSDFRQHPVAFFTAPLLEAHCRERFAPYCYWNGTRADGWTERITATVAAFRHVASLSDRELAAQIEADGIDIVVDLAGHTAGNRLLALARKPAPVAITWLGYFNTTGMSAMDYLVVDSILAPPGEPAPYVERPLRLDGCYLSYTGPDYAPEVSSLPALDRGAITFGCFNAASKITDGVVELWAALLGKVPTARLALQNATLDDALSMSSCRDAFARHGIGAERLLLSGSAPHPEFLARYREVDIALDPFPYNGGTTTCEALWMGVPVVSLAGDRFVSRVGATILHHAGCGDWVAHSPMEYVERAAALAADHHKLAAIRAGLRDQVRTSVLGDVDGFRRRWEDALGLVWRTWCSSD